MSKSLNLDLDVQTVLNEATFTADSVKLNGALPRPLYVRVNKVLELAGGIWNRKRAAHIFGEDPARVLGMAIASGSLDSTVVDISKLPTTAKLANFVPDLFPTPSDLARRMVQLAGVEPNHAVLEPSAGTGRIVDALDEVPGVRIVAVEINPTLAGALRLRTNKKREVLCGDFLSQNGNLGKFDRVVMNPPFGRVADISHILHALTFLNSDGRLVSICLNGSRQQAALRELATSSGGIWEELPVGTFKEAGTNVSTVLLSINR